MPALRPLLVALLLAGCAAAPPTAALRAPSAPIWSNAQLDLTRLPGRWRQGADFGAGACPAGSLEITRRGTGLAASGTLCQSGRAVAVSGPMVPTGPGRLRVAGQEWWVIWADTGYRTLAIATPSGAFGFVLDREGPVPPDRLRAAREIFDFNGYDAASLRAL
jgi:apolipoprotein D and lipocalin family protein